jgi:nicotinamide-nucleotide amidase
MIQNINYYYSFLFILVFILKLKALNLYSLSKIYFYQSKIKNNEAISMEILERIKKIIDSFSDKNLSLALAESCTGGYISHMLTNISGSSKVFERGIICYSNQAKIDLLNVDKRSIEQYGAVSETVAKQLAFNIRILSDVDIGIGITGIAGPTGGTPEKPIGLVFIGFSTEEKTRVDKHQFNVNRITFKNKVLEKIVNFLEEINY